MKIGNKDVPVGQASAVIAFITSIISGWLFIDGYFAHAGEIDKVGTEIKVQGWTMEQSVIDLRLDVIDERLTRELKKKEPDREKVRKFEKSMHKLETRQEWLQQLQDQK